MGEERVMEWVGKMKRGSGGEWWRREGGVVDSDEWGEGGGVGTDGRVGSAAGPSSSMCALVVRVRARRLCARSSSACVLVVVV